MFLMEKDSCQPYEVTYLHKQNFIEPVFSLRKNTQLKVRVTGPRTPLWGGGRPEESFGQLVALGFDVAVFTPAPYPRHRL